MGRYALILTMTLLSSSVFAQTIEEVSRNPPALPKNLPWWGAKKEKNPVTWADLKEKVVLVHFWVSEDTSGEANLHYFTSWKETYEKEGLKIIGIHIRSEDRDWEIDKISKRVKELLPYFSTIIDENNDTMTEWGVKSAPSLFLIDRQGKIRYQFEGLLSWKTFDIHRDMEKKLQGLLKEKK